MLPDKLPRLVSDAWFPKPASALDSAELEALETTVNNQLNALVYNFSDRPPIGLSHEQYQAVQGRQNTVEADGEYVSSEEEDEEEEEEEEHDHDDFEQEQDDFDEDFDDDDDDDDEEMMDEDDYYSGSDEY